MRFIHAADIHLGAQPEKGLPWAAKRGEEIWETFRRLVAYAEQEKVDFLFIAGDLFHRQPLLKELKEVNYHFSTLTKTKVVLIAGNHDYIKQDSYYRSFPWCSNVSFIKSSIIERIDVDEWNLSVYGASYHAKEDAEHIYDNIPVADKRRVNILLGHGGEGKHRPYDLTKLRASGFDYIALFREYLEERGFWWADASFYAALSGVDGQLTQWLIKWTEELRIKDGYGRQPF